MTLKFVILLFIFSNAPTILLAQAVIKKFVQANSVAIATISSDSTDYSDFTPIREVIGNARVVMLGEQDHGDASTFFAKTRLIQFLHEKMGFDVLAFESDFFALNEGFDRLMPTFRKEPALLDSFVGRSIYSLWTYCNECKPLFKRYIPSTFETSHPLLLTGFDNQMYLPYSAQQMTHSLDSLWKANNLPVTKSAGYTSEILPLIDLLNSMPFSQKDTSVFSRCAYFLTEIKNQMEGKFAKQDFWMVLVDNLIMQAEQLKEQNIYTSMNLRDLQMAKNLHWLCRVKYPDKKIIAWAANAHISKFSGHYEDKKLNQFRTMGTVFAEDLNMAKETYVLGFTSYQGVAGRVGSKPHSLDVPKIKAFENWFSKGGEFGFVDFLKINTTGESSGEMFYMNGRGHTSNKAVWNKMFDGIFYIKNMYPCTTDIKFSDRK